MEDEWGEFGGESTDFKTGWDTPASFPSTEGVSERLSSNSDQGGPAAKPECVDSTSPESSSCAAVSFDATTLQLRSLFPADQTRSITSNATDPGEPLSTSIEVGSFAEAEDFIWQKSMCQLLLYAQIGVAVPRYELEMRRDSLISDAAHRFVSPCKPDSTVSDTSSGAEEENAVAISFRRRASSTNIIDKASTAVLDGLMAGVTATTMAVSKTAQVTAGAVKEVGRGIGVAGSAVGSAVTMPVRAVARVVTSGPHSSSGDTSPSVSPECGSMFEKMLARLGPEEVERLGILKKSDLTEAELAGVMQMHSEADIQIESEKYILVSDEAKLLAEKMRKMELALHDENAELQRQNRIIQIEREEELKYPEESSANADVVIGDDGFSREMTERGLHHVRRSGSEVRIRHSDLPSEFDLFDWIKDSEDDADIANESSSATNVASTRDSPPTDTAESTFSPQDADCVASPGIVVSKTANTVTVDIQSDHFTANEELESTEV